MGYCWRCGVVMAVYLALIAVSIVTHSDGRELRPSNHGLAYQESPAAGKNSPEMLSFFRGTTFPPPQKVPLPEAKNMSDESWWRGSSAVGGGRRGEVRDHVREALLVASLVCGIAGVALLVVAAFLFLFPFQKQRSSSSPSTADK
ncbi:uncharacterized protein LOC132313551 [Cornus florida]|uniref:uncharacterized protein LOC132313551 n=1 Tax=Cornus florida TaxID=4283 RepID=UPI00289F5291|nr:uncharacterized protein LOC132313551 [Cornus florida]